MAIIPHPSTFIQTDWQTIIRGAAAEAERLGMLHPEQLTLVYQQKWFKALMPAEYGGLELSLPQLVRLQEGLSWADGSFGWVFTLCCGAGWFAGFIGKEIGESIFISDNTCLAGSGASTGEAVCTSDGYILNGQWNYASGAHHATHFTANCTIKKGNEVVTNEDGTLLMLSFIVDRKDVELLPTWKYMGMVATGSHSFKITNLHVGRERCFNIDPASATLENRLYQYPFLALAEATLAANIAGMAVHFIDLAEKIVEERTALNKYTPAQKNLLQHKLISIKTDLDALRNAFYKAVDASWKSAHEPQLSQVSKYSRQLARQARTYADDLYPFCGLQAASPDTEINRVWRDLHTASQHSLLTFES